MLGRLAGAFARNRVDGQLLEELEESLVLADVGVQTTDRLMLALRQSVRDGQCRTGEEVKVALTEGVKAMFSRGERGLSLGPAPSVILVVGVNGSGKTTTIAKLAQYLKSQDSKVMLVAGDTFRAAAIEQLQLWGEKIGCTVIAHHHSGDSASVAFDGVQAASARGFDVVIVDTAGRIHTKTNLMNELRKIHRVVERAHGRPPDETLLVLDTSTGQNAVAQAEGFLEAVSVTGLVLAKMDGTAKGGVVIAIEDQFGIPIKFIGTGEGLDDLAPFEADVFVEALFQ